MQLESRLSPPGGDSRPELCAIVDATGQVEAADPELLELVGPLKSRPNPEIPLLFWSSHGFIRSGCPTRITMSKADASRVAAWSVFKTSPNWWMRETRGANFSRWLLMICAVRSQMSAPTPLCSCSPRLTVDERVQNGLRVMERNTDWPLHLVNTLFDLWKDELGLISLELSCQPLLPRFILTSSWPTLARWTPGLSAASRRPASELMGARSRCPKKPPKPCSP